MRYFMLMAALLSVARPAGAQVSPDSAGSGFRRLGEVEVVSSRVERPARSARPLQTMDKDQMRMLGIDALADAVRRFAGVSVQDYGGLGGLKTISVRNLGAHHTTVSYDGVAVSNTQAGQIDLSRFATDNVQTLTLAMGEADDVMQSARHCASAAVLEIHTERPQFAPGEGHALRLKVRGGSWGLVSPSLRYWQRLGGRTVFSLTGTCVSADGMYPYTLRNGGETVDGKRRNSDIFSLQGEANLNTVFADSSRLGVKANWFRSRRGLPGAVIFYNDASSERMWDEEFFAQAVYRCSPGRRWRLETRAKYSHTWNRYADHDVKYADGVKTEINRQDEYYSSATVGWFPCSRLSVALAQDMAVNTLNMRVTGGADPVRLTSLTSFTTRWSAGRLELNASLAGTFATERVASGSRPPERKRLSPSFSASFRLLPSRPVYLRFSAKHTFRLPTFNDMYYDRVGTLTLRPERAREYNVGLSWTGRPLRCLRHVSIAVDAYHNDVRDKIVATPTLYVWKMANFGRVSIDGVSATVAAAAPLAAGMSVGVQGSYTFQRSVDVTDKSAPYYKNQLPYTPRHSGNVSLTIRTPWVDVGYTLVGCGQRYSMVQGTAEYLVPGYCDQSLSLSRELHVGRAVLGLQAVVRNLAGEHYEVIKFYPMPGRSVDVTAYVRL